MMTMIFLAVAATVVVCGLAALIFEECVG
ncbi:hypothetical protein AAS21_gp174 [Pantoea phage vB_PagS_AAS21]|uniref:Uncharacterized protein n=1 Tax=Pantoea phage vB_PagS_AAS21 TaxID=2575261 RepID=A0A4Y5P1U1_9CAUD|nr:hypothetical protein AAS21_gp174 [Pantoea phage vB_PagS_AAS21]